MMAKINAAYTARDLQALESLSAQPDCEAISEAEAAEQRLASLRDTLQRIQQRRKAIEREIDELVHSDSVALSVEIKLARQQGRDVWAEMQADAEMALTAKKAELSSLKAQLRALGIE
jgi:hypothetical protein